MRVRSLVSHLLILSSVLLSLTTVFCRAEGVPDCSASSAILFAPASGSILFQKNADQKRPIASTTKIMTALTVLRKGGDLDRLCTIPPEACGIEGTSIYLKPGETLSVRDLLYALLLSSANDAATALALLCSGSIPAFAEEMNRNAEQIGLENTFFMNPHGLDHPEHYSTARDLALLAAAAFEDVTFREMVSTRRYSIPAPDGGRRFFLNHNKLLTRYPDCVGVKTGFTKKSGRCLVSAAERDGVLLISVTLNDPNDWNDHTVLFDYGFSLFSKQSEAKDINKDE